ncbi:MAG: error-prone DNA polymerase [Alphaproteobacteria bacterium]|nr:error-prone DNA polymerase [Alphaproteobacteria bacterium]
MSQPITLSEFRTPRREAEKPVFHYAELAVTTNFSFLRGASHPQDFVTRAAEQGYTAIGIADRNSLAGVVRAYDQWQQLDSEKPRLLIGTRLVFRDGTPDILAYPRNRRGYAWLSRLISIGKQRATKGECLLDLADLLEWRRGLLLIVMPAADPAEAKPVLQRLGRDTWLGASMLYTGEDRRRLRDLKKLSRQTGAPLIAVNDVLYDKPEQRDLQDVVTCIREHLNLKDCGKRLEANAERHLKTPEEMARLFREAPNAVDETLRFAHRIDFHLGQLGQRYPREPVPRGKTPDTHLRDLTEAGLKWRYPNGVPPKVAALVEKELAFIADGKIAHYFLTVHDIVKFARSQNILCQGRGSAANSVICYALDVTAVDPNEIDVLFERFLNTNRKEPPDIDVDFEHERREEVIQYIYRRYGLRRAALTATVIHYRPRSAIREVGKVFGLTEDITGKLADTVWGHHGDDLEKHQIIQGECDPENVTVDRAVAFAKRIMGFPRHLSQHVGGFVLTRDRLDWTVPIGPAAMDDRYFIEWDKDDLDTLAIMKVDVLALGMLTCIRKAFDLIHAFPKSSKDKKLLLATVPQNDAATYDMLCKADSIGVFQVESRAQMSMLPRLQPRNQYDLTIEVAIVRPGPIQGDMVNPYLKRRAMLRANPDAEFPFPAPSPEHGRPNELHQILKRTLGVPLFQEQAMKMAIDAAKFTSEEANGLRRAMATFRKVGTMPTFEKKFVEGMTVRGYDREFAENCFNQIRGFGSYGFPESHAASFALLVYISAWIKCHHPAAFAAALLNSQPMGFYAPAEIVRCARENGKVTVLPPDVAFSNWDCTLERNEQKDICLRLGFRQIDGLREENGLAIMAKRGDGFHGFADFARRTGLSKRALVTLAEADAFRSFGLDRREGLWAVRRLPDDDPLPLFAPRAAPELGTETIAPLPAMPLSEHVLADYQTMRLSLKGYPTQFLRPGLDAEGIVPCGALKDMKDGAPVRCAGVVLVRQCPGEGTTVFITLSDETGVCNVVIWERVFRLFRKEAMGSRLLLAEGLVQKSPEGVIHLMAHTLIDRSADLKQLSGDAMPRHPSGHRHPRNVRVLPPSRDFH